LRKNMIERPTECKPLPWKHVFGCLCVATINKQGTAITIDVENCMWRPRCRSRPYPTQNMREMARIYYKRWCKENGLDCRI
jgi:hypothetical protein